MLIFYCPLWWLTQLYRTYGPSMYIYTACMHVCNTRKCTYIVWARLLYNQISGFLDNIIQHATIPGEKAGALASLCKCTEGINCLTFSDSILSLDVYIKLFCALLDAIECGYLFLDVGYLQQKVNALTLWKCFDIRFSSGHVTIRFEYCISRWRNQLDWWTQWICKQFYTYVVTYSSKNYY